jgi:NADH-quinone oxidoreductase subunit F
MKGLALDWESVAATGSILGSASFIVLDETVDMTWVAKKTIQFFKHESCGKCSPCREGTFWLGKLYQRIESGEASAQDVQVVDEVVEGMEGKCFCPLGEFAQSVPRSTLKLFAEEYEEKTGQTHEVSA